MAQLNFFASAFHGASHIPSLFPIAAHKSRQAYSEHTANRLAFGASIPKSAAAYSTSTNTVANDTNSLFTLTPIPQPRTRGRSSAVIAPPNSSSSSIGGSSSNFAATSYFAQLHNSAANVSSMSALQSVDYNQVESDDVAQDSDDTRREDVARLAYTDQTNYSQTSRIAASLQPHGAMPLRKQRRNSLTRDPAQSTSAAMDMPEAESTIRFVLNDAEGTAAAAEMREFAGEIPDEDDAMSEDDYDSTGLPTDELCKLTSKDLLEALMVKADNGRRDERERLSAIEHRTEIFFEASGRYPSQENYNLLLRVHAAKKLYEEGFQVYAVMQQLGFLPNDDTYITLVQLCEHPTADPSENRSRLERAYRVLSDYKRTHNDRPSQIFFHTLARASAKLDSIESGEQVITLMKQHGLQPNQMVYTDLIKQCRMRGISGLVKGDQIFNFMCKAGGDLEPDTTTYNTMLRLVSEAGVTKTHYAIHLFNQMIEKHYQPSVVTYANLIHACSRNQQYYTQAFEYFYQMTSQLFKPDMRIYNILLHTCAKSGRGDVANAMRIWKMMDSEKRDTISYNTMLNVLAESQTQDKVPAVMSSDTGEPMVYDKEERIRMANSLLSQMHQQGVPITIQTINTLVKVYTKAGKLQVAPQRQTELMTQYKFQPDYHSHKMLVDMFIASKRVEKAVQRIEEMRTAGHRAKPYTYEALLQVTRSKQQLTNEQKEEWGEKIKNIMKADGWTPKFRNLIFNKQEFAAHHSKKNAERLQKDTVRTGLVYSYPQRDDAMLRPSKSREGSGRSGNQADRFKENPNLAHYKDKRSQRAAASKDKAQGINYKQKVKDAKQVGHFF